MKSVSNWDLVKQDTYTCFEPLIQWNTIFFKVLTIRPFRSYVGSPVLQLIFWRLILFSRYPGVIIVVILTIGQRNGDNHK